LNHDKKKTTNNSREYRVLEYESSCDLVLKALSEANNKVSSTTFPHPWFGDMTYRDWAALVGSHMGIHRKQISSILEAQS